MSLFTPEGQAQLSELANRPPISERFTTSIFWPEDGSEQHFVGRIWKTCEDGPTFHDLVAGPFESQDKAAAMLEVVRANSARYRRGLQL